MNPKLVGQIHKTQKRRKSYYSEHRMVGAYVPNRVADALSLLSYVLQKSKTNVLREALERYYKSFNLDEEKMMKQLSEEIMEEWVERVETNEDKRGWEPGRREARWNEFKQEKRENLERAKLPQYYIAQVLRYIDQSQF